MSAQDDFLQELTELYRRHRMYIHSCGCCVEIQAVPEGQEVEGINPLFPTNVSLTERKETK